MSIFEKRPLNFLGGKKRSMPEGLWHKCPSCGEVIHELQLSQNLRVCTKCDHHFLANYAERLQYTLDEGSFQELDAHLSPIDALNFKGPSAYAERLASYQKRTGMKDAVTTGHGTIDGVKVAVGVMDFRFLAATMGSVVGEKITRLFEYAAEEGMPAIVFSAAGGARVHEGAFGLMQMAKTSGALAYLARAGQPFISVLTHPTTGGVTASFATLGDVILAEPKAMVGFAGPRVIKETTHQELPAGFQTAEFLEEHGLIDSVVHRHQLKETLSRLLRYMQAKPAAKAAKPARNGAKTKGAFPRATATV
jgi:acetyl-CoA carboxylase carboxyl transferase subunit beta